MGDDPGALVALIREQPEIYRMSGPQKLLIQLAEADDAQRISLADRLLNRLATGTRGGPA